MIAPADSAMDNSNPMRWRPDRVPLVSPDGAEVWLFGGAGPVRLAGRDTGPLARAVDGQRTLEEIIAQATADGMPAAAAERFARKWLASGHLVAGPAPGPEPSATCVCTSAAAHTAEHEHFRAALAAAGVDTSATAAVQVVLVDDLLAAPRNVTDGAVLLAVQVRGSRALVSPLLAAHHSCPCCLHERLRQRRMPDLVAAARVGRELPPPSPVLHAAAFALAAGAVAAKLRLPADRPDRSIVVIDPVTGSSELHALIPVAACPACDPQGKPVVASHLHTSPPDPAAGDTFNEMASAFRTADPEETWQRFAPLISDVAGIVPYVRPTGPSALRAFSAGGNTAATDDVVLLRSKLRSGAGGKGLTLSAARTGALAEALERDSLRARGNEPHQRARLADLEHAIHPNTIQLFSDTQLHEAEQLRALGLEEPVDARGFHRVPRSFDTAAEHDWCPVTDLRTGARHWLPASLVWFNWPGRQPDGPTGCSNGAAAGNTLAEALLQGLLELVERDAVALWWHPRCRRPAIDLTAWQHDPRIAAALAPQRALGSNVWVLDLTTDLGIPAAVAVATGTSPRLTAPLLGFGAHLDPVLAVVRALTELAQMQAPVFHMPPDQPLEFPGEAERIWFSTVTPEREPWLRPHGSVLPAPVPAYARIEEALDDLRARLAGRNLQVLWADCTRPDIGLPVVRTWVPGLRHFWNRFAPGRLYDVPPAIGWRAGGYGEAELNPLAMIL